MKGPHTDAGIKMYLHSAEEIAELLDVGFVASPGTHNLIGIKMEEAQNLHYPWSECGTKQLTYYDHYSYIACKLDYDIKDLNEMCGCRDAHMPGNLNGLPPICNISTYFSCVLGDTINKAVRTTLRVEKNHFVKEYSDFTQLVDSFMELIVQSKKYVGEAGCSKNPIFCQICDTTEVFVMLYEHDMGVLFQECSALRDQMGTLYEPSLNRFLGDIQKLQTTVETLYKTTMLMIIDNSEDHHQTLAPLYSNLEEDGKTSGESFRVVKYYLDNPTEALSFDFQSKPRRQLVKALVTDQCEEATRTGLDELMFWLNKALLTKTDALLSQRRALVNLSKYIIWYQVNVIECLGKYKTLLRTAMLWGDVSSENIDPIVKKVKQLVDRDISETDSYKTILSTTEALMVFTNSYANNTYTDANYDDLFRDATGLSTKIDFLQEDVRQLFTGQYLVLIENLMGTLRDNYQRQMEMKTIDEQFIGRNFMKVDIFYEQLKYEKTAQVKAYNLTQFCSDFGGMMGLLVGGSVLSLVEILDLFVYNGIMKLRTKCRREHPVNEVNETNNVNSDVNLKPIATKTV